MPRAAAVVLVAVLAAGCSNGSAGYSDKVERDFVGGCTSSGASKKVCACVYDRLVDDVPFEDFEALDARRDEHPGYLSPELRRFAVDCATEDVLGS
jgi:hypothetical protein